MTLEEGAYLTIREIGKGIYTESRSKFLAFAHPVRNEEEATAILADYRRRYHDARHVCFAYVVGSGQNAVQRSSDDGEPSGTAGKPILNCILSRELQQVAVIVVRYFGGVKLGTGPLGKAYRTATQEALDNTEVIVRHHTLPLSFHVTYEDADKAERALKLVEAEDIRRTYGGESIRFDAQIISGRKTTLESALENFSKDFQVTETEK